MSDIQRRRRQKGQVKTVSEGEDEIRTEPPSDTASRKQSVESDRASPIVSDAGGEQNDHAPSEGRGTPTKSKSTPTRRSKSLTNRSFKAFPDAKPVRRNKQNGTSKPRSDSAKPETENATSSPVLNIAGEQDTTETDEAVQVIDYATIDSTNPTTSPAVNDDNSKSNRSPPFRKFANNARGRSHYRESPPFSPGYTRGRGGGRGGRQNRKPSQAVSQPANVSEHVSSDVAQDDEVPPAPTTESLDEQPVESQDDRSNPQQDSHRPFHRGGFRGRYRGGDPAFRRGRGSWRGFHRGGASYQGSRPNYAPSPPNWTSGQEDAKNQDAAKEDNVGTEDQLAEAVSQSSLAPAEEQAPAGDQTSGDTKGVDPAKEAAREAKKERNRRKKLAKRLTMQAAAEQQSSSETKDPLPSTPTIPGTDADKTPPTSDRPKKSHKNRPFGKGDNANPKEEVVASESVTETTTTASPEPSTETEAEPQPEASPSKAQDDRPRRQKKGKDQAHGNWTPPQNVDTKDRLTAKPTEDSNVSYESPQTTTTEPQVQAQPHYQHHKSNYKRNMTRQEDNARMVQSRNDVPVPMAQQMQPTVSTPSFVSQPVAFAITSPNGGPIPVYTMPFPPMNPAMGDVQSGRQGMFYAPMMGSPGAAVSTPNAATPMPPPTMMDPNNMMYMPYESPQMMMYSPYWYQPVGMTQQGMPPPAHGWNTSSGGGPHGADYNSNNWKPPSPDRSHHDPNYHSPTGVSHNQHSEPMSYPSDNSGHQAVYYYPVSY
ncbi:hypothetical protein Unana1_07031 [Umbelopsis nana]